ncbi:MAG: alanine/glycine:cation symporter family protein [Enterobacteriaceae bacterium]
MSTLIDTINGIIWSPVLVYLCLGVGLYFSLRSRFLQLRHLKEMVRLMFDSKPSESGISSFQALTMTLAGRVGTGNIAGVATAITFGGPGAMFWMWMVAFLGASTAFVESTLGQVYKEKLDGQYRGGPAFYIEKGLGMKWFGWLFALSAILSMGVLMPGIQANAIAEAMQGAFNISPPVTAAVVAMLLGFIIFGGIRRIAAFASTVVPFMALGYVVVAAVIVAINIEKLPGVIWLIYRSAFGVDAAFGAIIGQAIMWGVKRGIYSNEAGQGTGAHAASAAEVSHPTKQGLVQAFSVYIDTLLVCSATGFILLISNQYNVQAPDGAAIFTGIAGIASGPGYIQVAMENAMPGFGAAFVAIALFFFAFTTIMAYYYIAETNIAYINRKVKRVWFNYLLRFSILAVTVYGAVNSSELAWALGDIGLGLTVWLNVIAILFLQNVAWKTLHDYEQQFAQGIDPLFHPEKLGIQNAEYWAGLRAEENLRKEQQASASDAEVSSA